MRRVFTFLSLAIIIFGYSCMEKEEGYMIGQEEAKKVVDKMIEKFGIQASDRIKIGVEQVRKFWSEEDGSLKDFENFCMNSFIADKKRLDSSFMRIESAFETINGLLLQMERELQWNIHVDVGPIYPVDLMIASFNLSSHLQEDLFKSKLAFFILLNWEKKTLQECLRYGGEWDRKKWAEVRLAQTVISRVPSEVQQEVHEAFLKADNYISNYNIYMHNLLTEDGKRLFPKGLKLISHWGLRDELKQLYKEPDGFEKQKMIYEVMKKIIYQEIPKVVINNPDVDWKVYSNQVIGKNADNTPEPNTRYKHLLAIFNAEKRMDQYYPSYPTFIDRRFNLDREIPEDTVVKMLDELLSSDEFRRTAKIIEKKLGRKLEPFDIWYTGLRGQSKYKQEELDRLVKERCPDIEAFEKDIPSILMKLGFDKDIATFIASKIEVDPARGAGHAMGAERRDDKAHLRTRFSEEGMDYKAYNIAIHELGHNTEQVISLNMIDYYFLHGVPNTAFTEAFAFLFQKRDLQLLGLDDSDQGDLNILHQLWSVCEIAGVSLVDIGVWKWMYNNPDATTEELKNAVIKISKEVWNKYFYPVFGIKDEPILAIYSHMIDAGLYLPDYPIGHIIQFQIEDYMKGKIVGEEMLRMCKIGEVTPDQWMKEAVGSSISPKSLLNRAHYVLERYEMIDK
ncbi:MAG: hypothetical protein H0Z29_02975 [Candidatus Marinimicrobia bacterium]|nr:hypothetical protein [Candidatus Neomarinimicrobiota bacterium]